MDKEFSIANLLLMAMGIVIAFSAIIVLLPFYFVAKAYDKVRGK